jgi:glucose-1-phosphate adenylyltransferase
VTGEEAHRFGILQVDGEDRLTGFLEKPRDLPHGGQHLASMGIYIFDMNVLLPVLEDDARSPSSHDFGKDIIPALIAKVPVYAYRFTDENKKASKYWRDIGTLDAYYEANMDLCRVNPEFNLYDPEWPIRTHQVQAPPAKFVFADEGRRSGLSLDSLISAGCIISGSMIRGSVLCPNVRVHSFSRVEESILMPGVRVGRHAQLRRVIVDRDVFIPRGAQIGHNVDEDRRRHTVTDRGIVVVTKEDEPFLGAISDEALRNEAEFDGRGSS